MHSNQNKNSIYGFDGTWKAVNKQEARTLKQKVYQKNKQRKTSLHWRDKKNKQLVRETAVRMESIRREIKQKIWKWNEDVFTLGKNII